MKKILNLVGKCDLLIIIGVVEIIIILYCCQIKQHQKINQTKSEFGHDNNVQNWCSFWIFDLLKCFSIIIVLNINFK